MTTRVTAGPVDVARSPGAILHPLPLDGVALESGLLARRQSVNRASALPHGFRMLEAAGNLDNLRIASGHKTGRFRGRVFMDSDVYKWLDAAAQGADGYLNSYYTVAEPGKRWTDLTHGHELYCAGHLIQAAIASRRASGDERLLAIARRFVDHVHSVFGP